MYEVVDNFITNVDEIFTFTGKTIDGYIEGATVFLDQNYNFRFDTGELSSITKADGSFEISNVPAVQGSGVIVSQSNQISGWGIQYTGSTGNAKIETGTTYPSASVIAVDEDKVLIIVNAAGTV